MAAVDIALGQAAHSLHSGATNGFGLVVSACGAQIGKFTPATTKFVLGGIRSDYISLIFRPLHKLFHARGPKFDLLQDACLRVYLCISFTRTASQHLESLLEHQLLCPNKSAEANKARSNICREPTNNRATCWQQTITSKMQ